MLVLGIETTCDETACAIVKNGQEILANVVISQANMHSTYGGVVPELSSRKHIDIISSLLFQTLNQAQLTLSDIDLLSVANGPGLIGSLLVGINFAKGLALGLNKPLIAVNHVEAHLYASFLGKNIPPLPAIGLVISGGHTALLHIPSLDQYELLGETQDDAIGEAFDKVATLLNLPYPGGPAIEQLAKEGDPYRFSLPTGKVKGKPLDFSFSGLKTAILYLIKGQNSTKKSPLLISESEKKDVAASFQYTAFKDIVHKTLLALYQTQAKSILFGGGVSANQSLRNLFLAQNLSVPLYWPEKKLSVDNAAMIATLGYFQYKRSNNGELHDFEAFSRIAWNFHSANRM